MAKKYYYYKHLSDRVTFVFESECSYCGTVVENISKRITKANLGIAGCCEQEDGIEKLKQLIDSNAPVEIDNYEGFSIVRIGDPKTISLYNDEAREFMTEDLKKFNGLMAYWDYASVAFITSDNELVPVLEKFLKNVSSIEDGGYMGITLKIDDR